MNLHHLAAFALAPLRKSGHLRGGGHRLAGVLLSLAVVVFARPPATNAAGAALLSLSAPHVNAVSCNSSTSVTANSAGGFNIACTATLTGGAVTKYVWSTSSAHGNCSCVTNVLSSSTTSKFTYLDGTASDGTPFYSEKYPETISLTVSNSAGVSSLSATPETLCQCVDFVKDVVGIPQSVGIGGDGTAANAMGPFLLGHGFTKVASGVIPPKGAIAVFTQSAVNGIGTAGHVGILDSPPTLSGTTNWLISLRSANWWAGTQGSPGPGSCDNVTDTFSTHPVPFPAVTFYTGKYTSGTVTTTSAWTNDNSSNWSVNKTTFNTGDPIRYVATVNNTTGAAANATMTWNVTGPGGHQIAYWSGSESTGSGTANWGLGGSIPTNACSGAASGASAAAVLPQSSSPVLLTPGGTATAAPSDTSAATGSTGAASPPTPAPPAPTSRGPGDIPSASVTTASSAGAAAAATSCGYAFTFSVTYNGVATSKAVTFIVNVVTPPAAPTLSAAAQNTTTVKLTWTESSTNATGFSVYRYTWSGSQWTNGTFLQTGLAASTRTYTDSTASPLKRYQYNVGSYNSANPLSPSWSNAVVLSTP